MSTPLRPAQSSLRPPLKPTHSPDDSASQLPVNLSDEDFVLDYHVSSPEQSKGNKIKQHSSKRLQSGKTLRDPLPEPPKKKKSSLGRVGLEILREIEDGDTDYSVNYSEAKLKPRLPPTRSPRTKGSSLPVRQKLRKYNPFQGRGAFTTKLSVSRPEVHVEVEEEKGDSTFHIGDEVTEDSGARYEESKEEDNLEL